MKSTLESKWKTCSHAIVLCQRLYRGYITRKVPESPRMLLSPSPNMVVVQRVARRRERLMSAANVLQVAVVLLPCCQLNRCAVSLEGVSAPIVRTGTLQDGDPGSHTHTGSCPCDRRGRHPEWHAAWWLHTVHQPPCCMPIAATQSFGVTSEMVVLCRGQAVFRGYMIRSQILNWVRHH